MAKDFEVKDIKLTGKMRFEIQCIGCNFYFGKRRNLKETFTEGIILSLIEREDIYREACKKGKITIGENYIEYDSKTYSFKLSAPFMYDTLKRWINSEEMIEDIEDEKIHKWTNECLKE